jgi:hypothetical protein
LRVGGKVSRKAHNLLRGGFNFHTRYWLYVGA